MATIILAKIKSSRWGKLEFRKKQNIISLLILALFIFAFVSIVYVTFGTADLKQISMSEIFYLTGRFMGLIGFLFISFLIISGDLARFFDRFFGIDRIIKFQRKFAILTYFVVFSHPFFFILSSKSFLSFLIPNFSILPLAAGTISLYLFIGVMLSSLNYKKISYRAWQYIHISTYALFLLVFYHSINYGRSYSNFLLIKIIYWMFFIAIISGIIYRANYKLMQKKYKFKVKEIKWETADTFTLVLEGKERPDFKAGQFFFLRIEKDKLFARHPFSVSSSPLNKDLNFTIKLKEKFTKTAKELKKGEEVKLEGPFGNFNLKDDKKDVVFIAGGVGITPFMSMIREKIEKGSEQKVILLYGSKTHKEIIFQKEIDSINEEWFDKVYILSQEDSKICEKGDIDKKIIERYVKNGKERLFYICGPERMKDSCFKILRDSGVKKKDIFFEDFFW